MRFEDITQLHINPIQSKAGEKAMLVTEIKGEELVGKYLVNQVKDSLVEDRSALPQVKDVVGLEARFMVSENGQLISKRTNKLLSQTPDENGYLTHATKVGGRDGRSVLLRMHRVVAEAFLPNPDNKPFVNHGDGIKTNNARPNLEWSTHEENMEHASRTGLITGRSGVDNSASKLSEEDVRAIRAQKGIASSREVARNLGTNKSTVNRIWNNERYSEVK